jgi:hypothetical protein
METMMTTTIRRLLTGAAALTSVAALAPAAFAGCGGAPIEPASYLVGSNDAQLIRTATVTPANLGVNGIVGLWAVQFTVGGSQFDFGYAEWHSDGTEIMNSGGRAPATENFCLGVWRQSGPNTYHLKHYALSYTSAGVLANRVVITEDPTVSAGGTTFSGPASYDIYDASGTTLLQHVPAMVTGHRILPN